MKFSPAVFTGRQAIEVAIAIRDVVKERELRVWACAAMPDHVHLITRADVMTPAKIVGGCRARASRRLHDADLWPAGRPVWGKGQWVVDLETPHEIRTRIAYVERNPVAAGLPPQGWSFVTPYEE